MTVGTGNFPELLWPGISDIFQNNYDEYEPLFRGLFKKKTSDKAFEKEQGVVNLPLAGVKDQGSPIPMFDPMQGYQKEYVNVTYAIGSSVTREMFEDDQYNIINGIPAMLAESMTQTEEIIHHDIYNNGFSSQLSADGVSIFNTAHPLVGGGTLSNMGQTGVTYALSQTTLEQACIFISRWTDDRGFKKKFQGIVLAVPNELMFTAEKILQTEYEVGTGNNTINPVRGKMKLTVSPYFTDTDSWFIITDITTRKGTGFVSYERRAREINRDNEFLTQNLLFTTSKRFSCGCTDWRGAWGSQGA